MTQLIQNVLQSWETSIMHFNKLDAWKLSDDLSKMSWFIRGRKGDKKLIDYVRYCRDNAMNENYDINMLLGNVKKALDYISSQYADEVCIPERRIHEGQSKQYRDTTKALYHEKLKFKDNERLLNVDVTIEDKKTSKKVRKIIEKRMCQAYFKQNKDRFHEDNNRSKHNMKRAVSFQLHNMGQIEDIYNMRRERNTHWKVEFDQLSGNFVYKKKTA